MLSATAANAATDVFGQLPTGGSDTHATDGAGIIVYRARAQQSRIATGGNHAPGPFAARSCTELLGPPAAVDGHKQCSGRACRAAGAFIARHQPFHFTWAEPLPSARQR